MPTVYEDEDIDTDAADDDEEVDETEVDDEDGEEGDEDDEIEDAGESISEEDSIPEINAITQLRQKSKQETLFRDALASLAASNELKTEPTTIASFEQFLTVFPQMQEVVKMMYLNWKSVKPGIQKWDDLNSDVLADVDAMLATFHVDVESKFIDWTINSVLQWLVITAPFLFQGAVLGTTTEPVDEEERTLEIPELKALASDLGFVMIPRKVYKRLKQGPATPEKAAIAMKPPKNSPIKKKKKKGR